MSAHIQKIQAEDGLRFSLIAANGEPVMQGTEAYRDEHDLDRGITDAINAFNETVLMHMEVVERTIRVVDMDGNDQEIEAGKL